MAKKKFHRYDLRDQIIRSLGFSGYPEYLRSETWRNIRRRVLARDACKCGVCMRRAFYVHHMRYDIQTLSGESIDKMVTICKGCHERIEFDRNGKKNSLGEANAQLDKLRSKTRAAKRSCKNCRRLVSCYELCLHCRQHTPQERPQRATSLLDYIAKKDGRTPSPSVDTIPSHLSHPRLKSHPTAK